MKQFQLRYEKEFAFSAWLQKVHRYCDDHHTPAGSILFRIYSDSIDSSLMKPVLVRLRDEFPDALYAGVTSIGNIIHGSLADSHVSITCTIFEDPDTQVRILQYPMTFETQKATAEALLSEVRANPWVRAVEILSTLRNVDMIDFFHELSDLPEEICVYGGGAYATDIPNGDTSDVFVLSSEGAIAKNNAVFILMGGPNLHIDTTSLTGWQRLGKSFTDFHAEGKLLKEINGYPAAEVYRHLLDIPEDHRFFRLANVFPLSFKEDETDYLRAVVSPLPDGSLQLSTAVNGADTLSISYGDPVHIFDCLQDILKRIQDFSPQVIQLFSCAARKFFWGNSSVSRETLPFESLASTSGFYTSGEFLRNGKKIFMHNITLVIVSMREGAPETFKKPFLTDREVISHQKLVGNCLVSYINALSNEEDPYRLHSDA